MNKNIIKTFLFCFIALSFSIFASDTTTYNHKELIKPSMVTSHPLGIFMMRVDHNFNTTPPKKIEFIFNMAAANVWLPIVRAYQPTRSEDKGLMKSYLWHQRRFFFDPQKMPHSYTELHADAIIHTFKPQANIRVNNKSELRFIVPFYYLNKGSRPFTYVNNDQTIEDWHSNNLKLAGGEDPFARRDYGFDKVNINYVDVNGRSININKNTLVTPGFETHYFYYPSFNTKKHSINIGAHAGINTSNYNRSLDLGTSLSFIKRMKRTNKREFILALGNSVVRNKLIQLKNNVQLNNNKYIYTAEGQFSYTQRIKKTYLSIGINYLVQTRYNKKQETESIVLESDQYYTSHWHWAISQFYETLETWSLIATYSRKISFSIYIKEDLNVNNAPDLQSGCMLQIPF